VRFLGYRPDARSILPGHRIYVHGAAIENHPVALIEALAASLPVAAAPVGGIGEIFSDGVEGIHWRLNDPESSAEALIGLLEDDNRYRAARMASGKTFLERFSVVRTAPVLEEFLRTVSAASPGR
jgi:glycosyltransferase involved in cell wall biosynthesis